VGKNIETLLFIHDAEVQAHYDRPSDMRRYSGTISSNNMFSMDGDMKFLRDANFDWIPLKKPLMQAQFPSSVSILCQRIGIASNVTMMDRIYKHFPQYDSNSDCWEPETFCVLRFPFSLRDLGFQSEIADDVLFVREDDFALLQIARSKDDLVITGSPGVSKSWFQLRFLLLTWNPQVYFELSGEKELPLDWRGSREAAGQIVLMKGGVKEQRLVNVTSGSQSTMVARNRAEVLDINTEDTTVLFEPGHSLEGISSSGFKHFIITASPDRIRYIQFLREWANLVVYPCWTVGELLIVMDLVEPSLSKTKEGLYSEEEAANRIRRLGFCIRYFLAQSRAGIKELERQQDLALADLDLKALTRYPTIEKAAKRDYVEVSHWILRYEVDRKEDLREEEAFSRSQNCQFYEIECSLVPSSASIEERLGQAAREVEEEMLMATLKPFLAPLEK